MTIIEGIHDYLTQFEFPLPKEAIVERAVREHMPSEYIELLNTLPEHYYGSVNTVIDALHNMP